MAAWATSRYRINRQLIGQNSDKFAAVGLLRELADRQRAATNTIDAGTPARGLANGRARRVLRFFRATSALIRATAGFSECGGEATAANTTERAVNDQRRKENRNKPVVSQ
jgi:hypothetical protein